MTLITHGSVFGEQAKYVGEYKWDQALVIYSEAIQYVPDDSDLYCSRGVVYHEICNCTKAITDLNEAIRLNSKSYYAFANRGRVFLSTGEPEKALDDLRVALRVNPAKLDDISKEIISAYMACADTQEKKCNWDLVIDYLTELRRLELIPAEKQLISYSHTDDSKAKRKNKTGIPAAAKWDNGTSKLFSSPPKSISIEYKEAGSIRYLSMDDKKSSIDVSSKSNNRNDGIITRLTNAYKKRSVQHADNQRWDQAIADLNEVLTLAPKQSNVLMDRAILYHRKGDHAKAVCEMTEIIKTERYPHDAYLNRGTVYFNIGELDKAIADYSEVIRLYQGLTPLTYYRRAETYLKKGDCESALADANAAIKLDSTYAEAYECRGRIYEKLGDKVHATEDFQKAKSLLEQDAETAETLPVAPAN